MGHELYPESGTFLSMEELRTRIQAAMPGARFDDIAGLRMLEDLRAEIRTGISTKSLPERHMDNYRANLAKLEGADHASWVTVADERGRVSFLVVPEEKIQVAYSSMEEQELGESLLRVIGRACGYKVELV